MPDQALVLNALLRQHLSAFVERVFAELNPGVPYLPNWHIEAIEEQLIRCLRGEVTRLIITMPPRSLKSICASVAFPAWALGNAPNTEIICASYAQPLASELSRATRRVMRSPWYRRAFPRARLERATEDRLITTLNGGRMATSVGGVLTGVGGDIIIIDDPMKAQEANSQPGRDAVINWFDTTLLTRLNNKQTGIIILVMQRVHMDDLAGHLLKQGGWAHLDLPAIAEIPQTISLPGGRFYQRGAGEVLHPAREPRELLEQLREEMGTQMFSAQYQQRPIPAEGNMFRWEWIQLLDEMPTRSLEDGVYQSWDMAVKESESNDYSVCTTWLVRDGKYYLLDVFRGRLPFPLLRQKLWELAQQWRVDRVIIEDAANGSPLLQELTRDKPREFKVHGVQPERDKGSRFATATPVMEQGKVFMPANAQWLRTLMEELLVFPNGKYDDQVDSVSQFLNWHRNRNTVRVVRLHGL
jgi:predicted phage terminase large subunit-like protein